MCLCQTSWVTVRAARRCNVPSDCAEGDIEMAVIDFPAELPMPLRNGYDTNHVSPLMRTELQTGRARQRRRYTSVPTMASVSWIMTQQQAQLF